MPNHTFAQAMRSSWLERDALALLVALQEEHEDKLTRGLPTAEPDLEMARAIMRIRYGQPAKLAKPTA